MDNTDDPVDDKPRVISVRYGGAPSRRSLLKSAAAAAAGVAAASGPAAAQRRSASPEAGVLAHTDPVTTIALSGSSLLISGGRDKRIKFWQLSERAFIQGLNAHQEAVTSIAVSPDDRIFATGSADKSVKLWSLTDNSVLATLAHEGAVHTLAFSPDGKVLVSGGADLKLRAWRIPLWGVAAAAEVWSIPVPAQIASVAIDRGGTTAFAGEGGGRISAWSLADGTAARPAVQAHTLPVRSLAVSPDGRVLASGGGDAEVKLWTLPALEPVRTLRGHRGAVKTLAFAPDGARLFSGGEDDSVRIWLVADGRTERTLSEHAADVNALAVTRDGRLLVSASDDRSIRVWELPTGSALFSLMDLEASPSEVEGIRYTFQNAQGITVTYTMPCGSPIPANAVCVCNCVAGTWTSGVTAAPRSGGGGGGRTITGHYWYPN